MLLLNDMKRQLLACFYPLKVVCNTSFFFSFFFKIIFIHSFILVHSFTKYVLDHIQNIGNDRNVQSVPEGKN